MKRIVIMVLKNLIFVPYMIVRMLEMAAHPDKYSEEERYALLKFVDNRANRGGRVTVKGYGVDNIPKENGFIFFPNHQGLYDVLAIMQVCPNPFSVVMKQEVANIPFLKQVFAIMKAKSLNRSDLRQGMKVIQEVAQEVKEGRNYIIFAEGTRSKEGNKPHEFKGGSFKSAYKAKCPIIPVALIDTYKAFDINSIKKLTVQVHFLKPILYEEYKDKKTTEIAAIVKERIEETIRLYETDEN